MAYYSDLEHIKSAFFEKEIPDWEFYRGTNTNKPPVEKRFTRLIDESPEGAGLDESWNQLEDVLNRVSYKGGKAVLFLGPKGEHPVFAIPISLSKHTMSQPPTFATGQRGGISSQQYYSVGARSVDQTLADKMRIYDLEHQLQNDQGGDMWSQIGQTLLERIDPNTIVLAVSNLISSLTGKPLMPTPITQSNTSGEQYKVGQKADGEDLEESIERLMQTISQNLDDDPDRMKKLFDNLERMVATNPAMIKQLSQ